MESIGGPEQGSITAEKPAQNELVDQKWFTDFSNILATDDTKDAYIPDAIELEQQKAKFLNHEIDSPNPILVNLDYEKISRRERDLLDLKREIIEEKEIRGLNEAELESLKWLYRWRINEEIARVRMYKASKRIQELRDVPGSSELELRRNEIAFDRYNRFIFGEPSPEIFSDILLTLQNKISEDLDSDNPVLSSAAKELHQITPKPERLTAVENPDSETFEAVKLAVLDDIHNYNITLDDFPEKSDAALIQEAFSDSLDKIGAEGWVIEIDTSGRRLITISQAKKKIAIPAKKEVGPKKLRELSIHEILTHALRGVNGSKTKLGLSAIGLDRYERADEGLATARTQSQKENFESYASMIDFFAVSLARGLDKTADGKPNYRNFGEVYEIMFRYNYYKQVKAGKEPSVANEKATLAAWNTARMCFRGSGHTTKGICSREKIMYREGNIEIWGQLKSNPNLMKKYMISLGKIDTNNKRHLYALHQLRIISKDELEELESSHFAI